MSNGFTRRQLLGSAVAAGAASVLSPVGRLRADDPPTSRPAGLQPFRFVHFTDIHVQRELKGNEGFAMALRAANDLKPRPDFILTGGDLVFDVLGASVERAKSLFGLYKSVIADNTSIRVIDTIGNHDVFGWAKKEGVTEATPGYGKEMVKDSLGLRSTYSTFDHKGWRFFSLDNIQPGVAGRTYTGYIDKPQMEWLAEQLKRTDPTMPCVFCEHIPSVTVTGFGNKSHVKDHTWNFEGSLICDDAADRLKLIEGRNVRLWLSGHIHLLDKIEFRGTTFICDGAVSGAWWKGPHEGVKEGFGVIDCHADGRVEHQYFAYGWKAEKA